MDRLSEKVVGSFKRYLDNLNYGNTKQNYELLYSAILLIKTEIDNDSYEEFFYNNLN